MYKYLVKCLRGARLAKRKQPAEERSGSDHPQSLSASSAQAQAGAGQPVDVSDVLSMKTETVSHHPPIPFGVGAYSATGCRMWNEDNYTVVENFFSLPLPLGCEDCSCALGKSLAAAAHPPSLSPPKASSEASGLSVAKDDKPQVSSDAAVVVSDTAPAVTVGSSEVPVPPPGLLPILKARVPATEAVHFFAVYDGHGGADASKHCAAILHGNLATILQTEIQRNRSSDTHHSADQKHDHGGAVQKALFDAFIKTDEDFAETSGDAHYHVGTTAVAALVGAHHIWTANAGDSRAVLYSGKNAIALSRDHKGSRSDEVERVEALGGVVVWDRVNGELAVTRAIGDTSYRPYVIAEPEVSQHTRSPDDQLLVLASDGLWDVMGNNEACALALEVLARGWAKGSSTAREAAQMLVDSSMAKGTRDNVTAVVVDLRSEPFRGHRTGCGRLQAQQCGPLAWQV